MKKFIISFILMLSSTAFAAPQDVNVPLGGGTIKPNGELQVSFDQLKADVAYNVTCKINADDATIMHFKLIAKSIFPSSYPANLNGQLIGDLSLGINGKVNKGDNELSLSTATNSFPYNNPPVNNGYLDFLNLDNTVTENVSCSAVPTVNLKK